LSRSADPERLSFDSDEIAPVDRVARYRALYARGADVFEGGADFRAKVEGYRLDRTILYERRLHQVVHERDLGRTVRDGFNHFTLTIVISGHFDVVVDGVGRRVQRGCAVLIDTTRPMRNHAVDAHILTLSVARDRIDRAAAGHAELHGLILRPGSVTLLRDYLVSLTQNWDELAQAAIPAATAIVVALLAIAFRLENPGRAIAAEMPAATDEKYDHVRRLIEAHLGDPNFGPRQLTVMSGIARATLYRMFRNEGGLAAYLLHMRLDQMRRMLASPGEATTIAAIVDRCGFVSQSHASRVFLDRFGLRPTDYRNMLRTLGHDAKQKLKSDSWQVDLT